MNNFNFLNNLTVLFNNKEVQNKNNTINVSANGIPHFC